MDVEKGQWREKLLMPAVRRQRAEATDSLTIALSPHQLILREYAECT